jgi:hypothetical protein
MHHIQGSRVALHVGDAAAASELPGPRLLPDTEALADRPKPCLQEVRPLPRDWTKLFAPTLHGITCALVPEATRLYDALGVKKAPLGLIAPSFEVPLPPLTPAVFPPAAREPLPPPLELFDLDEAFASTRVGGLWTGPWPPRTLFEVPTLASGLAVGHGTCCTQSINAGASRSITKCCILALHILLTRTAQTRLATIFNKCTAPTQAGSGGRRLEGSSSGGCEGPDLEGYLLEAGALCGLDKHADAGAQVRAWLCLCCCPLALPARAHENTKACRLLLVLAPLARTTTTPPSAMSGSLFPGCAI